MKKLHRENKYKSLNVFHFSRVINQDFAAKKQKRGIIFGNFGAKNYGDDSILAGQLQELRKVKNLRLSILSRSLGIGKETQHVRETHIFHLFQVVREILDADFLIVGGGGLFCRNDSGLLGFLFQVYTLFILSLPLLLRKKVYVLGIGMYTNMNHLLSVVTIQLLKKVSLVTVRDFHSLAFVKKQLPEAVLYQDNSSLMELKTKESIRNDTYFKKTYHSNRKNIGISVLKTNNKITTEKLLKSLVRFMNVHADTADFWIYCIDTNPHHYNDALLAQKIIERVNKNVRVNLIPQSWHPARFFSSFLLMDYFISMRLHSSIFCYRTKTPFFALSYDIKCDSFLKSVGKEFVTAEKVSFNSLENAYSITKKSRLTAVRIRRKTAVSAGKMFIVEPTTPYAYL